MKPLFLEVTPDRFELPVCVADSPTELARLRGVSLSSLSTPSTTLSVESGKIVSTRWSGYEQTGKDENMKKALELCKVRPLADNTQRRIIRGVDKFTIKSGKPFLVQVNHAGGDRAQSLDEAMPTITGKHGYGVVAASVIQYHGEQGETMRGQSLTDPLMVVDASNRYGLTAANLVEYYGNAQDGLDLAQPLHTATAKDREGVACAHIVKFKGQDLGQHPDTPLHTITASAGEFGAVYATVTKAVPGADLRHWPEVRALLNEHCGYTLADDEVLLLHIGGVAYFINDIGLRMLTPRELYNAMGFPADYIIDHDYLGKDYSKSAQVARCGNAVCPPVAGALVAANCKEQKQTVYIATMRELWERVAV